MRIYDEKNKKALETILIMLTPAEVKLLIGYLKGLDEERDHVHVNDEDYKREITIGLYTPRNIQNFADDVIRLIQEDE